MKELFSRPLLPIFPYHTKALDKSKGRERKKAGGCGEKVDIMEVHPQYAQTSAQELSTVSTVFSTAPSGEKEPVFRGSARLFAVFHTDCGKNFAPPVVNITISSIPVDNFLPIHKGRINSLPLMCRGRRPCELRLPACRGSCQSEGLTEGVYGWTKQKGTDPSEGCLPLGEGGHPLWVAG